MHDGLWRIAWDRVAREARFADDARRAYLTNKDARNRNALSVLRFTIHASRDTSDEDRSSESAIAVKALMNNASEA
jgi:hypothetical protein